MFCVAESISDNLILLLLDTCEEQPCGNRSQCTGPNQCSCNNGYENTGHGCAGSYLKRKPKFFSEKFFLKKINFTLAVCNGNQSCGDRGVCESPGICRCHGGYIGNTTGCNQGNY